ncbi:hypothetical protein HYDPIDRAFT_30564 [Hydnomerulius pinastri MD-312]|uniref:Beach-domain-containing protein n=1 Tax=Hydnomerulius pinastri MD-312 TaxID=994086 RepID=A0A0C9WDA3_9AGAM|nr:hypothetical protein HYDPIDRAFT_30564 [Hydnomerulius pinastri MD-312]
MLRSLLTPLRNLQDLAHETTHWQNADGHGLAHTASVDAERSPVSEQVQYAVEELKFAEDTQARITILRRLTSHVSESPRALDAFRAADGFLVLMHVLSTLPLTAPSALTNPQSTQEILDCMQLAFTVTSKALHGSTSNLSFFEEAVGYTSLSDASQALLNHPVTSEKALGCLLSLSIHDFTLVDLFVTLQASHHDPKELDVHFLEFAPALGTICLPHVFKIAWNFMSRALATNSSLRPVVYKVLEHLTQSSHRNLAVLSMIGVLTPMFSHFISTTGHQQNSDSQAAERRLQCKILKRLFEMGASTQDARQLLQCAVKENRTLDQEMIDLIRSSLRSRWPLHISLQGTSALTTHLGNLKSLPASGFTFMIWAWFERMPSEPHKIFSISFGSHSAVELSVSSNGTLALRTSSRREVGMLSKSRIATSRWTHITLAYHPHRASQPAVRIFIDGVISESLDWAYPKIHDTYAGEFTLGDKTPNRTSSWCIASAYLLSTPLDDELPRFIHHLGPRYHANFQDKALVRFLTYEASTSLNMHMVGSGSTGPTSADPSSLKKAIRDGVIIHSGSILCKVVPGDVTEFAPLSAPPSIPHVKGNCATFGDVLAIPCQPLDLALWSIGGARLTLRLVSLAETQHELSRAITIHCDSLRNCWQNSEDMERIAGYDALASILRQKSRLINMTSFETLFEFLGLSFRSPDLSTLTNTVAYRTIALDFELWSMTSTDIQRAHLEHFAFLLRASRYRKFNARVRLSKLGIVRRLLFALQSAWYPPESIPHVVSALVVVMQAQFTPGDAIKPTVSYISANLAAEITLPPSPRSSFIYSSSSHDKAKQVLGAVVSLLRVPAMYAKFAEALPVTRVALLWLGAEPTPSIACQVLAILGISLGASSSFGKKFELASGWSLLRKQLPLIWDDEVHGAALDLLLQPAAEGAHSKTTSQSVRCPQILPIIFAALRQGLLARIDKHIQGPSKRLVDRMLGDLIDLHTSNSSFRHFFKSQSTTEVLIECLSSPPTECEDAKISTQLTHLGLLVAMGNHVSSTQKQQILDLVKPGPRPADPLPTPSSTTLAVIREETLRKAMVRLEEWRSTITVSERERYRKSVLDMRERRRRIIAISEGILGGGSERDVWSHLTPERTWRLDETEGPHRTRNKLESISESPYSSHPTETSSSSSNVERDTEVSSTMQLETPTKDDAEPLSDDNGDVLAEDIAEDKHRRVRHELEPGDIIEAVSTVSRVSGVDSYPGLLIFGSSHLYMMDALVENDVGEVIDAVDAPKGLFFVAGSTPHLRSTQRAQRWSLEQIAGFSNRAFLFRDVALEIFFKDSRTLLAVFLNSANRHDTSQRLQAIIAQHSAPGPALGLVLRDISMALHKGRASAAAHDKALSTAQRQWRNREISNYAYLNILNQLSGRTPSDATQYPVFPWVLKDYSSEVLDLSASESYRDLTKPMGALTPDRRVIAESRYTNLESVGEKPFHYGTHFSSSMIVCHFLIRMAPYTSMFKTLQGGDWDLPDRLFIDIGRAYASASQDVRGDVRELIPEFFGCPEFLENLSNLDFGISQTSGEKIHDVKLPPWAKGDPLLFVTLHRQALESHYVSENLPAWIDLIWGCKQRDVDSLNVFHPLSYEDLDKITDPLEREATIGIIHNFGQTPRKLFNSPHPSRNLQGLLSLPVQVTRGVPEDALSLTRDPRPLKLVLDGPVACIATDSSGKVVPMPEGILSPPSRPDEQVQWDKTTQAEGGALRVLHHGTVVQTIEATSPTCAAFADQDTLVTGSSDCIVRLWHISHAPLPAASPFASSTTGRSRRGQEPSLSLVQLLRGHSGPILCVEASRAWSIAISGSSDGSAVLWDLNRGLYVRSIWHAGGEVSLEASAVHLVAINESTGYVATCSAGCLWLHTINARPIAKLDLSSSMPRSLTPHVTSIAFHEREYSHLGILAAGHADGSVALYTWNADGTPKGCRAQWEFVKIRDLDAGKIASEVSATALKFVGETLWVGDSSGKVFRWMAPD